MGIAEKKIDAREKCKKVSWRTEKDNNKEVERYRRQRT